MEYVFLFFILLRAASEASLVVIAYAAIKYLKFKVPSGPSFFQRLKQAYKAF